MVALKQTDNMWWIYYTFLLHSLGIIILQSYKPRVRDFYFLSCYIQREETVPQNVELLSIFGSLAIFKVLHLDLKTKLIDDRFLSSFAQTLFWEQIYHPSCISEWTGCFHSQEESPRASMLTRSSNSLLTRIDFIQFY